MESMGSWDMQITSEEGLYMYEHWGRDTSDVLQFDIVLIPLPPFLSGLLPSLLCTFPFISLRLPVSHYSFLLPLPSLSPLRSYDRPKMIEALQGKHVREIACGSGHSAAITSNGELYTWGQGDHGRLGHGDLLNQTKPKQVSIRVWVREQSLFSGLLCHHDIIFIAQ